MRAASMVWCSSGRPRLQLLDVVNALGQQGFIYKDPARLREAMRLELKVREEDVGAALGQAAEDAINDPARTHTHRPRALALLLALSVRRVAAAQDADEAPQTWFLGGFFEGIQERVNAARAALQSRPAAEGGARRSARV